MRHPQILRLMNQNGNPEQRLVTLKGVCGPGDNEELVITITYVFLLLNSSQIIYNLF